MTNKNDESAPTPPEPQPTEEQLFNRTLHTTVADDIVESVRDNYMHEVLEALADFSPAEAAHVALLAFLRLTPADQEKMMNILARGAGC